MALLSPLAIWRFCEEAIEFSISLRTDLGFSNPSTTLATQSRASSPTSCRHFDISVLHIVCKMFLVLPRPIKISKSFSVILPSCESRNICSHLWAVFCGKLSAQLNFVTGPLFRLPLTVLQWKAGCFLPPTEFQMHSYRQNLSQRQPFSFSVFLSSATFLPLTTQLLRTTPMFTHSNIPNIRLLSIFCRESVICLREEICLL